MSISMPRWYLFWASICVSCIPRKVPEHLKVSAVAGTIDNAPPTSHEAAIRQLIESDPLVRRPRPRSADWWHSAPGSEPILAWLDAGASGTVSMAAIDTLETGGQGTIAVPLARGARLAELEVALPTAPLDERGDRSLVLWIGSFTVKPVPGRSDVRAPLGWIASERTAQRGGLIQLAERAVLQGWLESPNIPLGPVADAMLPSQYDRLRATPEGALISARAAQRIQPDRGLLGRQMLDQATHLALVQAAADSIGDQQVAQRLSRELSVSRGQEASTDPLPPLLEDARSALTSDAGNATSLGLALVAIAAQRLDGQCSHPPCTGVDRVSTIHLGSRQSPEVEAPAWAWRLIAAKTALDRLDVSIEEKLPTTVFPLVADIIVGETGQRVPLSLLLQRSVGPEASLAISRGLGAADGTQPEDALTAVNEHIRKVCAERPSSGLPDLWDPPVRHICGQP